MTEYLRGSLSETVPVFPPHRWQTHNSTSDEIVCGTSFFLFAINNCVKALYSDRTFAKNEPLYTSHYHCSSSSVENRTHLSLMLIWKRGHSVRLESIHGHSWVDTAYYHVVSIFHAVAVISRLLHGFAFYFCGYLSCIWMFLWENKSLKRVQWYGIPYMLLHSRRVFRITERETTNLSKSIHYGLVELRSLS